MSDTNLQSFLENYANKIYIFNAISFYLGNYELSREFISKYIEHNKLFVNTFSTTIYSFKNNLLQFSIFTDKG